MAKQKGSAAVAVQAQRLGELTVEYVAHGSIGPNTYNPNRQDDHTFQMLLRSMETDGFTQPIIVHRDTRQIVDGEHRWRAAHELGLETVPIVMVDMSREQMQVATLRHNRARGEEDIELSTQVLRDLQELGALDWAQEGLGMSDDEISLMLDNIPAPEALAEEEFADAWEPIKEDTSDTMDSAVSERSASAAAVDRMREREQRMKLAKTTMDRAQIEKDTDIFRLTFVFTGEEAAVVRRVLGDNPPQTLLSMCLESAGVNG